MNLTIEALDPENRKHLETVARRMRSTLAEVVDPGKGPNMYSMDWLRARVLFHLDASQCNGAVFLAWRNAKEIVGHTILREAQDENGAPYGLFSTFYVSPEARRLGVGTALVDCGEAWFQEQGLNAFATNTAADNQKLIGLLEKRGYRIAITRDSMVHLRCEKL